LENYWIKKKASSKRKKAARPYSKGELNKLIDSLIHPLSKTDRSFIVLDGFLHGLVEQNHLQPSGNS